MNSKKHLNQRATLKNAMAETRNSLASRGFWPSMALARSNRDVATPGWRMGVLRAAKTMKTMAVLISKNMVNLDRVVE